MAHSVFVVRQHPFQRFHNSRALIADADGGFLFSTQSLSLGSLEMKKPLDTDGFGVHQLRYHYEVER
jgi:hypothetical protein